MNRLLLFLVCFCLSFHSFAQLSGTGFYRVKNVADQRYIYVTDNTGDADPKAPDMGAVQLIKDLQKTIYNPATVLFFQKISSNKNEYNIASQGTSVKDIIGHTPNIYYSQKNDAYQVYATVSGTTIYLGASDDLYYANKEVSQLSVGAKGTYNYWKIEPIAVESDNYVGIKPTIEIDGKYYQPFYADFAFSLYSKGMKAYYINETLGVAAHLVPIEDEIIAAATPVIIECSSPDPSDNRLSLHISGGKTLSNNKLKGVYFFNRLREHSSTDAVTKNDKNTMRVLAKTADGKLGFVVSNDSYLQANQAYLSVPKGSSETFYAMNDSEFASTGQLLDDKQEATEIYSILGIKFEESFEELPAGIYIINGKKVIKY